LRSQDLPSVSTSRPLYSYFNHPPSRCRRGAVARPACLFTRAPHALLGVPHHHDGALHLQHAVGAARRFHRVVGCFLRRRRATQPHDPILGIDLDVRDVAHMLGRQFGLHGRSDRRILGVVGRTSTVCLRATRHRHHGSRQGGSQPTNHLPCRLHGISLPCHRGRTALRVVLFVVLLPFFLGVAIGSARLSGRLFHAPLLLQRVVMQNLASYFLGLAGEFLSASLHLVLVHDVSSRLSEKVTRPHHQ